MTINEMSNMELLMKESLNALHAAEAVLGLPSEDDPGGEITKTKAKIRDVQRKLEDLLGKSA